MSLCTSLCYNVSACAHPPLALETVMKFQVQRWFRPTAVKLPLSDHYILARAELKMCVYVVMWKGGWGETKGEEGKGHAAKSEDAVIK